VVFVPDARELDAKYSYLVEAGVVELRSPDETPAS